MGEKRLKLNFSLNSELNYMDIIENARHFKSLSIRFVEGQDVKRILFNICNSKRAGELRELHLFFENGWISFPNNFGCFKNLHTFCLYGSVLQFPSRLWAFTRLKVLKLSGNIPIMNKDIENLHSLEKLVLLPLKGLDIIPEGLLSLSYLKYLDLRLSQQIEIFPKVLTRLEDLDFLKIRGHLKEVTNDISRLNSLNSLVLMNNKFSAVPEVFFRMIQENPKLKISIGRLITRYPEKFREFYHTHQIYIDKNPFYSLYGVPKSHLMNAVKFQSFPDVILTKRGENILSDLKKMKTYKKGEVGELEKKMGDILHYYKKSTNKLIERLIEDIKSESFPLKKIDGKATLDNEVLKKYQIDRIIHETNRDEFHILESFFNEFLQTKNLKTIRKFGKNIVRPIQDLLIVRVMKPTSTRLKKGLLRMQGNYEKRNNRIVNLNLEDCTIEKIPNEIGLLENLEILKLKNNMVSSLPSSFSRLKSLKKLDLSSNQLESFPNVLLELPNLRSLDLSQNNLEWIDEEVVTLPNLHFLFMRGNPVISHLRNTRDYNYLDYFKRVHSWKVGLLLSKVKKNEPLDEFDKNNPKLARVYKIILRKLNNIPRESLKFGTDTYDELTAHIMNKFSREISGSEFKIFL